MLLSFDHSWEVAVGKVGLLALGVLVVTAVFRKAISLEFETWRGFTMGWR